MKNPSARTPLDEIVDPRLRAALENFVRTGTPDEEFADRIRTNPDCQKAIEYLFDREMSVYQSFFATVAPPENPTQSRVEPRSVRARGKERVFAGAVLAASLAVGLAGSWSGIAANRNAKVEITQAKGDTYQANARKHALEQMVGTWPKERDELNVTMKSLSGDNVAMKTMIGSLQNQVSEEKQQVETLRKLELTLVKEAQQLKSDVMKREKEFDAIHAEYKLAKKQLAELSASEATLLGMYKIAATTIDKLKEDLAKSNGSPHQSDVLVLLQYRTRPVPLGLIEQMKTVKVVMGDPSAAYRTYLLNSMNSKAAGVEEASANLQSATSQDGPWTAVARAELEADKGRIEPLVKLLVHSQRDLLDERAESRDYPRRLAVNFAASQAMSFRWPRFSKERKDECVSRLYQMLEDRSLPPVAVYLSIADLGIRGSNFKEVQTMRTDMQSRSIPGLSDKFSLSPAAYFVSRTGLEK